MAGPTDNARFNMVRDKLVGASKRLEQTGTWRDDVPDIGFNWDEVASPAPEAGATLRTIAEEVSPCTRCRLGPMRIGRGKRAVPGEGNPRAILFAIGDRPGAEEETVGRPIIGPTSVVFDQTLGYLELDRRQTVFTTNVVKCSPPKIREPTKEEWCTCFSLYGHRQIVAVMPWVILIFGNTAFEGVMQTRTMEDPTIRDCRTEYSADFDTYGNRLLDYPHDPRIKVWWTRHYAGIARDQRQRLRYADSLDPLKAAIQKARRRFGV